MYRYIHIYRSIGDNAENDQLPNENRKSQQRVSTINNSTTECSEISELQHTLRVNYNNNDYNRINNERDNSSSSNNDHNNNNNFYYNNTSTECIISMHNISNAIETNHQGSGSRCDVQYNNATDSPVGEEDSPDDSNGDDDDDDNNNIEHVRQVLIQVLGFSTCSKWVLNHSPLHSFLIDSINEKPKFMEFFNK
ncbi:unnamed protein product [Trichobilharzia regenti]|nr:unnamed protein product [Trichobilharzia regenti]